MQQTNLQTLETVKREMVNETARTLALLHKAELTKEELLPEALQHEMLNLQVESSISRQGCIELLAKSRETQITALTDLIEEGIGQETDVETQVNPRFM